VVNSLYQEGSRNRAILVCYLGQQWAQRWWVALHSEYELRDAAALLLLQSALEAFDLMRQAQAAIAEHGVTVDGRDGQLKPNPACATARDARAQMMAALKQLNLDLEPLRDGPGRPPNQTGG